MQVEGTCKVGGRNMQWRWKEHVMEVEGTCNGSGRNMQWRWKKPIMEVVENCVLKIRKALIHPFQLS